MRIEILEKIGFGSHGEVFTARDVKTGKEVAVKIPRWEFPEENQNEFSMLQTIFSSKDNLSAEECILQPVFLGKVVTSDGGAESESDCLVMPLCHFSLAHFIDAVDLNKLNETERLLFLNSVFSALLHAITVLDNHNIHHADFKPENIVWDDRDKKWKVIDFGTARFYKSFGPEVNDRGTMQFRAPEYCAHASSADGPWSDMYSMGKILQLLLTGKERNKNDSNAAYYLDNADRYDHARAERQKQRPAPIPSILESFSGLESLLLWDQFALIAARAAATLEEDRPALKELQVISEQISRQLTGRLLIDSLLADEVLEAAAITDSDLSAARESEPAQFFNAPHYFNTDHYNRVSYQVDSHALSCASRGGVSPGAGSPGVPSLARTPRFFARRDSRSENSTPLPGDVAAVRSAASPCLFVPRGWDIGSQQLGFPLLALAEEQPVAP